MAVVPLLLGAILLAGDIGIWLLTRLAVQAKPYIEQFLRDPTGSIGRVGDVLVWNGPTSKQVLATLEGLTESQTRVEQVVGRIETAQISAAGTLSTLTSLSMATLGVTSLLAGFMVWRMHALHQRLHAIAEQLPDILAYLQADKQKFLQASLDFLTNFEHSQSDKDLHTALEMSTLATRDYQHLVHVEAGGRRRLAVLNQFGRYYLLSLTAQVRCLILSNQLAVAEQRVAGEQPTLTALARATFEEVMGKSPEVFLDPNFQAEHVTLDLMTEIYRQAQQLGAVSGPEFRDASRMFEHFRPKIYRAGGWFRPVGRAKAKLLTKLKYLMACLEEVSRIESLRLRVAEALAGKLSFAELEKAVAVARDQLPRSEEPEQPSPGVAFAFA